MKPTIHATCLVIGTHGVLLRGASGAGKSRLALHFIESAGEKGRFARLVSDDRVYVEAKAGQLIASAPDSIAGLIERRNLDNREQGIEEIAFQPSTPLALVVDILSAAEFFSAPQESIDRIILDGVEIAHLNVPTDLSEAASRIEAIFPLL